MSICVTPVLKKNMQQLCSNGVNLCCLILTCSKVTNNHRWHQIFKSGLCRSPAETSGKEKWALPSLLFMRSCCYSWVRTKDFPLRLSERNFYKVTNVEFIPLPFFHCSTIWRQVLLPLTKARKSKEKQTQRLERDQM